MGTDLCLCTNSTVNSSAQQLRRLNSGARRTGAKRVLLDGSKPLQSDNGSGTRVTKRIDRVHQIRLLITHRADGLVGQRQESSSRPNARAQESEFIGIYNNNNQWNAKVDSLNGNSHHVGPLDTDVVAAIYHDVLATRLHRFSYESNYPENTRTLKSFFWRICPIRIRLLRPHLRKSSHAALLPIQGHRYDQLRIRSNEGK